MIKKILIVLLIIVLALVTLGFSQPSQYMISRQVEMNVMPEVVFPHLVSSQLSNDWMPWRDMDPQMTMTYEGPSEGVGSKAKWSSQGDMGVGESEIVEVIPGQMVKTKLVYHSPMSMTQMATFTLTATGSGSVLRWQVEGENGFIGRVVSVFIDMDKMVGTSFEKGLLALKSKLETANINN